MEVVCALDEALTNWALRRKISDSPEEDCVNVILLNTQACIYHFVGFEQEKGIAVNGTLSISSAGNYCAG